MSVNFKHLAAFAAVARLKSFTAAARKLNISQPALTVQIHQLEEELSVRLLDRNTRSVRLTTAGAELAPVVERLLAEIESLVARGRELSGEAQGAVMVAALPSVAATLLPRIIATFAKRHRGVVIRVMDVAAQGVAELVLSGEADLGVGIEDDTKGGLYFTPLFHDRMCLVLPAGSALLRKRRIGLADLAPYPLILPARGSSVRALVEKAFVALGLKLAPAYEVSLMSTVAGMVRAGLGIAILPAASFDMGELAGLRLRSLSDPALAREVGLLRRTSAAASPAVESFVQEVIGSPAIAALRRVSRRRH